MQNSIKILYFLADDVPSQADLSASKQELELREQVAKEEKRSLSAKSKQSKKIDFIFKEQNL
jgi:hypothetical protein